MRILLLFLSVCVLFSCQVNDVLEDEKEISSTIEENVITFIYKGKEYTSEFYYEGETVIFTDEEVGVIAAEIASSESRICYVNDLGQIEYFTSEEEMNKSLFKDDPIVENMKNEVLSRAAVSNTWGVRVTFYKDSKKRGQTLTFNETHIGGGKVQKRYNLVNYGLASVLSCHEQWMFFQEPPTVYIPFTVTLLGGAGPIFDQLTFSTDWSKQYLYVEQYSKYPIYPGAKQTWNDYPTSIILEY